MTTIIARSTAEFLPVKFAVYSLLERDITRVDDEGNKAVVAKKGMPDHRTRIDLTLERCVIPGKIETVKDTIERLKKMLKDSRAHYKLLTAQESDYERQQRHKRDGLEVVSPIIITKSEPVAAPKAINDDEIVPSAQVRVTKKRSPKKVAIAA